jgi:hypothetical protein
MRWCSSRECEGEVGSFACLAFVFIRPVDTVASFPGASEKHGLSFGTRQMIFKELLRERVKRNIRLKSDKQEMPISINRQVNPTSQMYVSPVSLALYRQNVGLRSSL